MKNESEVKAVFCRPPKEPTNKNWQHVCRQCGQIFYSVREDASYCSQICRVRYYRGKTSVIKLVNHAGNEDEKKPITATTQERTKVLLKACCMCKEWAKDDDVSNIRDFLKNKLGINRYYTDNFTKTLRFIEEWNEEHPNEKHYYLTKETFKKIKNKFTLSVDI